MTDEKQAKLKKMFEMGMSYKDIIKELNISKSTLIRAIKKLPEASQEAREYNKKMSSYLNNNITYADLMCQDDEEGWIINMKHLRDVDKQSSRYFMGIGYEEVQPISEFVKECTNRGLKVAVSPLHNRDVWLHDSSVVVDNETGEIIFALGERYKTGDLKKEHYHYVMQFSAKVTFDFMYELHKVITKNRVIPKVVYSPLGAFEYLWHKNEDMSLKAHYSRDDVIIVNGFNPELTIADKDLILKEIVMKIREYHFTQQREVEEFFKYATEVITVMGVRNYYINNVLNEEWRMKNPEYVRKVKIIE